MMWLRRIGLFLMVNILVLATISILLHLLGIDNYLNSRGIDYPSLLVICVLWGFGGAFISLLLSRWMAKTMMGVQVIDPENPGSQEERWLVDTVHRLAHSAGLQTMPEVGFYNSPDPNAFATGPGRDSALVAVSSGLFQLMDKDEIEGVLGHELTHVTNGDMVTMTLIQGIINAFVMFLSRVLAFIISQAMRSRDDRDSGGGWLQFLLVIVFQIVFSLLGSIMVCWFSRQREFRADAGGARLAGRDSMINALRALARLHDPEVAAAEAKHAQAFQSLKISGQGGGFMRLFATHPPIEERIARLEQGTV